MSSQESTPLSPSPGPPRRMAAGVRLVRQSLRGDGPGPTEGPLVAAILLLAIPMVLEMSMESVFAVVDIFWMSSP